MTARNLLDPAIALGDEPWSAIEAELSAGTMQLVGVLDDGAIQAASIVRTAQTQRGDVLEVCYLGGSGAKEWAALALDTIKQAAADAGMIGVRIIGRPGWERVFSACGMRRASVMLESF